MRRLLAIAALIAFAITLCAGTALAEGRTAAIPTEFTFDTQTGEFSFTANDESIGYYFVRIYSVSSGEEAGEYTVSSRRLNGGKTGTISGKVSLDNIGWGPYHVKLVSFAASGTDVGSPDAVILNAFYGVGGTLERPEAMTIYSGNTAQVVIDWWTLCDYLGLNYMPYIKIDFWADEALTQNALTDTVDTQALLQTLSMNPPSLEYIWGYSTVEGTGYMYQTNEGVESTGGFFGGGGCLMSFQNDIYTYTLDAGEYYVTVQALSKNEELADSKVSTPMHIVLTDATPAADYSDPYEVAKTELWTDPQQMDMPGANPFQQADRVDLYSNQTTASTVE